MARKFEPLHKRWTNLAKELRKAKDEIDFGRVNPILSAEEQKETNEVAQQVDEVISDMRSVASELSGSFDQYVKEQMNGPMNEGMENKETRLALARVLVEQGQLDPSVLEELEGPTQESIDEQEEDDESAMSETVTTP